MENTIVSTRDTCKTVTNGTPDYNTLAVKLISAMPFDTVASTVVGPGMPLTQAKPKLKSAMTPISSSDAAATLAM
jgi:hypothetical protein